MTNAELALLPVRLATLVMVVLFVMVVTAACFSGGLAMLVVGIVAGAWPLCIAGLALMVISLWLGG